MRKFESASLLTAILLLLMASLATAAEYYTWVDENGVVNYSERSPAGYNARHVTPESRFGYRRGAFGDDVPVEAPDEENEMTDEELAASIPATGTGMSEEEIDAQIASEKARIDAEIAQAKKSNCAIGRRNLAQLEAYARIRVKDKDGSERMLTDQEKQARINQAKQTIRENCTG